MNRLLASRDREMSNNQKNVTGLLQLKDGVEGGNDVVF